MQTIRAETQKGLVEGSCDERFGAVAEEFVRNFAERGELGASVSLKLEGETLVDLWGGTADAATGRPWTEDTVSVVFSSTKGATALCAHILASRGKLDIEAPVAEIWPEFAVAGKEKATVRMMLDHSVGVPVLRDPAKADCIQDWDYMTERLAAQAPFWEPGTRNGYHALTFGFTVGEIVRRVSGKSLGSFFRDEVAGPLGIDFWIGLPEEIEPRVAPILAELRPPPQETPFSAALVQPGSIPNLFIFNSGTWGTSGVNSRAGHAAEIGAANGITNARGLAGLYAPLANGGGGLVDADTLARMSEVSMATHLDATLMLPTRFALGFMKSMDNRRRTIGGDSVIIGRTAFGHVGAGGSIGFADPECGLSFGYTMNRRLSGILMNERGQSLIDAAYRALGYRSDASGCWLR
ncbi:MAG TPA: serine hydrolase domain-containing protein [Aliidongia sp.]|nr:serine hydrolase domain-containing protein [Aliidongia sp.]